MVGSRCSARPSSGCTPPQPELFQLYEEEPGGSRPPCLGEPRGPQEKVQQCTVEQLADVVPMVQILDIPGPQGEEGIRWWRCCASSTCRLLSRLSQRPRSLWTGVPQRSAVRCPQKAEQLVEVPTERVYVFAIIATKALAWRGVAALAEQLAATPVL